MALAIALSKARKAAQARAYYARKRSAGLCTSCARPVEGGQSRCDDHLMAGRSSRATRYQRRVGDGKCGRCGAESAKYRNCLDCRRKDAARQRGRR